MRLLTARHTSVPVTCYGGEDKKPIDCLGYAPARFRPLENMRRSGQKLIDACADGMHALRRRRDARRGPHGKVCKRCGCFGQGLYDQPCPGAAQGDFRVVCQTDGCDYGCRTDADGHGYTNHAHILLAQRELAEHQDEQDDGLHAAKIQQHPIDVVVAAHDR